MDAPHEPSRRSCVRCATRCGLRSGSATRQPTESSGGRSNSQPSAAPRASPRLLLLRTSPSARTERARWSCYARGSDRGTRVRRSACTSTRNRASELTDRRGRVRVLHSIRYSGLKIKTEDRMPQRLEARRREPEEDGKA